MASNTTNKNAICIVDFTKAPGAQFANLEPIKGYGDILGMTVWCGPGESIFPWDLRDFFHIYMALTKRSAAP